MPETPIQRPKPSHPSILLDTVKASFNRVVRLIPPKGRAALLTGSIVLISLVVYTSLTGSATLNLICRHALRSAEISVSIDGKTIYADHISASPKKVLRDPGETKRDILQITDGTVREPRCGGAFEFGNGWIRSDQTVRVKCSFRKRGYPTDRGSAEWNVSCEQRFRNCSGEKSGICLL